jgi:hypothetical protein
MLRNPVIPRVGRALDTLGLDLVVVATGSTPVVMREVAVEEAAAALAVAVVGGDEVPWKATGVRAV